MIALATDPSERMDAATYIADRLGMTASDLVGCHPFDVLTVRRKGRLVGAVLYIHWRGRSIEAHWAGEPGWLTRDALRWMFAHPFLTLGVWRLVGLIPAGNVKAIAMAERLGFVREGTARQAEDDGSDLALYGMLKPECRWI